MLRKVKRYLLYYYESILPASSSLAFGQTTPKEDPWRVWKATWEETENHQTHKMNGCQGSEGGKNVEEMVKGYEGLVMQGK